MARNLSNKLAVITGGAEGIGFTIADMYLEKGAKAVLILDINENLGTAAVDTLNSKYGAEKAIFMKCDVTKDLEPVSRRILDTYKTIDILVNNAGILNEFDLRKTIDINVTAVMEWSLKFWEHMRKDKGGNGGTIINLSSIYGFRIDQFLPIYQASKFAVLGFTKSLGHAYNFERSGVRVIAICPGYTETTLTSHVDITKDQKYQEDFVAHLKQGIWQKAEHVGKAAVEVFEKVESGTAWLIEGGKPIVQVQ